jgi:prophage antirepressor-like protein
MADNIVPFDFNGFELRTLGTWDAPLFVALDVCRALGILDVSQACDSLDKDEKLIRVIDGSGQNREMICVSESGLYSLVLRSRKKQAKAFKKWITAEVIPSIRKTGTYSIANQDPRLVLLDQLSQLTHQQIALEQRQKELDLENQRLRLEQQQIQAEQNIHAETIAQHDAELGRIFEPDGALISLAGCLNLHGKHASAAQLAPVGKTAAKVYREKHGKEPERVGDARYGTVRVYPQAIAMQALKDHGYLA